MKRMIPNKISILILIFLFKFMSSTSQKISIPIEAQYMKIFELQNGNFLVCTEKGIYFNQKATQDFKNITVIENANFTDFKFIAAAQFKEEAQYVVILYKNMIYIFSKEGAYITKKEINLSTSGEYYSLILYKIEKNNNINNYLFFIGYLEYNGGSNFKIAEYYFSTTQINLVAMNNLKISNYSHYLTTHKGFSCEIMNLNNNENVLTCFFAVDDKLVISSFDLNNFTSIDNKFYESPEDLQPIYIHSGISEDKSCAIICYLKEWKYNTCDKYKINDNSLKKIIENNIECNSFNPLNSFLYTSFAKNNFISGSAGYNKDYHLIIFDSDFDVQNVINITDYICEMLSFSVFKSIADNNKYSMAVSCGSTGNYYYSNLPEGIKYEKPTHFSNDEGSDKVTTIITEDTPTKTSIITQNNDDQPNSDEITALITQHNDDQTNSAEITSLITQHNDDQTNSDEITALITQHNDDQTNSDEITALITPNNDGQPNSVEITAVITTNNDNQPNSDEIAALITQNNDEEFNNGISNIPSTEIIKNESCSIEYLYQNIETKECLKSCTTTEILEHICKLNFVTNDNINNFTENIRNLIKEENITSDTNIIIEGSNTIYQIISSEKMKENENTNLSIIDLGDCEKKLKSEYILDYLLIMKIDTKIDSNTAAILNYEIYAPYTKEKLNLSICSNIKISTYSSYYPSEESMDKIKQLKEYGYDLYNIEDPFYQDICATFTSENGTDMLLSDRKSDFYENVSLCENDCVYKGYYMDRNRVKCECNIKQEIIVEENSNNDDNLFQYLLSGNSFSNLKVLKCFSLVFSKEGIKNNKGSIIFICINFSMIILSIIYGINQEKFISRAFKEVNEKYKDNINKKGGIINTINNIEINSKNFPPFPPKKKRRKKIKSNKNIVVFNNINNNQISNSQSYFKIINQNKIINEKNKERYLTENNIKKKEIKYELYNFTNEELNALPYDLACKYDKRTYFQYYISLLKQKHLIFFTFFNFNDYNIFILKLSLFLSSFALYFAVNAVFFTDETMHNIYKGDSGIISQISNIFYSTIISCIINIIIKKLGLSNDSIVKIKQNPDIMQGLKQSNILLKKLKIKFGIFFILNFLLISFFWYFITAFCAVYKNTQNILIENTFASFALSLVYPLGINLIPGILRIYSLKKPNKGSKYFYFMSRLIALI